jgi:transcriptional regulator with PAS, ATPase and Fis domain
MSHLEPTRSSPRRVPPCQPRGGHRCFVDDVLRGMSRQAGGEGRTRPLSEALEGALRRQLGAQWVRIRAQFGGHVRSGGGPEVEADVVRVPVPTRGEGLGWVLEIGLVPGQVLSEEHWQAIRRGVGVWELAAEFDRKGGALPRMLHANNRVRDGAAPLIGRSQAMCHLRERIERVAATDFTVLIEGESGSGKELVARQIHDVSARRRNPFIALNCAAIVDTLLEAELFGIEDRTATGVRGRRGKFEHASGGTLFLDEVADLSASAQAKLLRAIQERVVERVGADAAHAVDIRLVVATNRPLRELVRLGEFRSDLFYRLSGIELIVPPLRSRREDTLELARYFLVRHGGLRALGLSAAAENALFSYDWPGNVRELERMMESAVVLAKGHQVELHDLPREVRGDVADVLDPSMRDGDTLRAWCTRYVKLVLHRCGHNKRAACRALDISYHTLQTYLRDPGPSGLRHDKAAPAPVWPAPSPDPLVHERAPGRAGPPMPAGP